MAPPVSKRICTPESEDIGQQFIDTWSHYISLLNNNTEADVLQLVDLLEEVRKKWQQSEIELSDTRKTLAECVAELNEYKRRWKLLPSHFKILSSPPLATLDEDDGDQHNGEENIQHNGEENIDSEASTSNPPDTPKIHYRMRRSVSVPFVNESHASPTSDDGNQHKDTPCYTPPRPNKMGMDRIENRVHVFERIRIFTKVMCYICSSNIRFGSEAVKCQICKLSCHQHCSRRAPVPCIPWASPPKATNGRLRLGDYCASSVVPKLPHLIIRCVQYLNTQKYSRGLYTHYDHLPEDDLLFQLLHAKSPPDFKSYGPEAAAYCIIKFLTNIRESLIPESSFKEFSDAAKVADNFDMETVIAELPIVHKNTLAYLVIHWKLLIDESAVNGLTEDVLARALIPVIMRGTETNLALYLPIFPRLLSLSTTYWEDVVEEGVKLYAKTPISRTSSKKVMIDVSRTITVAKLQQSGFRRRL
uniref:Rac GTPase-activating protein 1 n=1 Tax=Panagrolaimus sp. ES5 TaxID=591445 RepID=A0AC34GQC4_9BILA